jgi:threonine/homoserine/homoserine lactone efflux protein
MEPMDMVELAVAFGTALLLWLAALITPGPDFAATAHASVLGSRRAGLAVAGGVTVGMAGWATASLFGLHAILFAFTELALAVRFAGAAYLVYLGLRLIWSARHASTTVSVLSTPLPAGAAFRRGLLTNLANPKALALFGSLFAVLVPADAPNWFSVGLLLAILVTTGGWYTLVALALSTSGFTAGYRRFERAISVVTGVVFVGVGGRLATDA